MKNSFAVQPTLLAVALGLAYPMHAMAASAGVAQFTAGDVSLRRPDGRIDPLSKGKELDSGQAIITGINGRVQVKFSDGGLLSLQPNTEFKITNYVDQADPKQDRFLVDLLRGSMRAITGLIGKRNRDNYKVTTTTATIGIRGSGFSAGYNPDGSLSVTTEFDAIEVCNAGGCVGLTAGESVRVVNNETAPARTNTRAPLPTPPPQQTPDVVGNQTTADGNSAIVPPVVPRPAKVLVGLALAGYGITAGAGDQGQIDNGALALDSDGKPERFVGAPKPTITRDPGATTTVIGSTGSLATGDLLLLGTWSAATLSNTEQNSAISPVAFVSGVPTSGVSLASLAGQRGEYRLSQATPVISNSGARGELLSSSKVSVDFFGVGNYADVDLNVRMAGPAAADYNLRGGAKGNGAGFEGVLSVASPACIDGSLGCGRSSSLSPNTRFTGSNNILTGYVNGFASGPNAANIGLSYGAYGTPSGDFGGAATFGRNSIAPAPSSNSLTDLHTFLADGSGQFIGYVFSSDYYSTITTNSFSGEALTRIVSDNLFYGADVYSKTGKEGSFSAIGKISDPDFIGWGSWVKGSFTAFDSSPTPLEAVHYLVGRPTPVLQMPTLGTAAYALIGGTVPTATLAGTTINGTLLSANMSADFGLSKVNVNIATQFAGTPVNINIGNTAVSGFGYISGSIFSGCTSNGTVSGMFSGDKAFRAGLVYGATDPTVGNVAGAVAFQRVSASGLTVGTAPR